MMPLVSNAVCAAVCLFGTLASEPQNAARNFAAGMRLATVSLAWDRYEPERDRFAAAYVAQIREQIAAFRQAGLKVVVDRCMKVEHARHMGRMHWLGFNTGVVGSQRQSLA